VHSACFRAAEEIRVALLLAAGPLGPARPSIFRYFGSFARPCFRSYVNVQTGYFASCV